METPNSSEVAPSPSLERVTRPTKIKEVPDDQVLALFDLDGTLTKPGSELLIQKFIQEREIGSMHWREKLLRRFEIWSDARRDVRRGGAKPDYEQFLTDVGNLWAKMLARGDHELPREELMGITKTWFEKRGKKQVMDYSRGVIREVKGRYCRPVMVTGAPFEIAAHFANHLGIEHVFAMEAETDERGIYTGEMEHNTGLGRTKGKVCKLLAQVPQKTLYAMGDTYSDSVLMRYAIEFRADNDGWGRAVLINPREEIIAGAKEWANDYIRDGKIKIIEQHTSREEVLREIRHLLDDILRENRMKDGRIEKAA